MITNKHITKIVAVVIAIAVVLSLLPFAFYDELYAFFGGDTVTMEYETELFNTDEIMQVNIIMSDSDWDTMLANATSEEYYDCNVEINGEMYYHVGIRPKGNTSLTSIASDPDTNRFSFKLEFGHFVEGQTCKGLDKLILNNNYADATNMKEALIYDMYQYMGADASLYNYATISVNGEYWGVYLALESVEESFMLRNYGVSNGELYKPDSLDFGDMGAGGGGGGADGMSFPDAPDGMSFGDNSGFPSPPDGMSFGDNSGFPSPPDGMSFGDNSGFPSPPDGMDFSGFPGFPGGDNTAAAAPEADTTATLSSAEEETAAVPEDSSLEAADSGTTDTAADETTPPDAAAGDGERTPPDGADFDMGNFDMGGMFGGMFGGNGANLNYTDDSLDSYSSIWDGAVTDVDKNDKTRVVAALKAVFDGTDLESCMDVDNILKYMAVHVFSVNNDSLTGSMAHNYYLYESEGKLNIIPWDYNLSLGGMGGSSDASGTVNDAIDNAFSGTDFFDTLMENDTYHEQYYAYLAQLVDEYINGGAFDAFYERVRSQIDALVATDPTAFYEYEEYLTAVETLYQVVKLRGESISAQLDGTIASYASERSSEDELIDTTGIDMSTMGSMNTGGGGGEGGGFGGFGGGGFGGFGGFGGENDSDTETGATQAADSGGEADSESDASAAETSENDSSTGTAPDAANLPEGFDASGFSGSMPEGFDPSSFSGGSMPEGFDPSGSSGGSMPEGFDPSAFSGGSMPEGFDPSAFSGGSMPEGFDPSSFSGGSMPEAADAAQDAQTLDSSMEEGAESTESAEASEDSSLETAAPAEGSSDAAAAESGGEPPRGEMPADFPGGSSTSGLNISDTTLINYGISLGLLIIGFVVLLVFKRRRK